MGFAAYWRWKSRPLGARPRIGQEVRDLIRRMSFKNPLWGAPRIHVELLKLGIEIAQLPGRSAHPPVRSTCQLQASPALCIADGKIVRQSARV
jgi:hypothetical protein